MQTGDVVRSNGRVRDYSQTLNEEGVKISRIFPAGTILITIAANIGYSGILEFDSACPDSLIGITPRKVIEGEYLPTTTNAITNGYALHREEHRRISTSNFESLPTVFPPKDEQRKSLTSETVDRKIDHESKKRSPQDLQDAATNS